MDTSARTCESAIETAAPVLEFSAEAEMQARRPPLVRPKSAVSVTTGALGLAALTIGLWLTLSWELSVRLSVVLCLVLPAAIMVLWEVVGGNVQRSPDSDLDFNTAAALPLSLRRSATKLLGIWASWAGVAALYAFLPYYQSGTFQLYYEILITTAPFLVGISVPYVVLIDMFSKSPYDENWHFGALLQGRWEEIDREKCKHHILNYAIKGFFLSYMFNVFVERTSFLQATDVRQLFSNPLVFYVIAVELVYYVDIVFATIGYALTLRIFGAHIRSPNTLLLGWVAALACYPPFAVVGGGEMINFTREEEWQLLVPIDSVLGTAMITAILFLTVVYSWATVAFGIRFSNLTHRGIITSGPYALTKHPAYLAKNLSWWLVYVPFIPVVGGRQAVAGCLSLLIVNGIYYARAKTEEAHLMADPVYQAYAAYIAEHGIVARMSRLWRQAGEALLPASNGSSPSRCDQRLDM